MENKRVLLGMSGGVDSSVSAVLLKENGYEVIGATMELFSCGSCCNINTYIDAKNVCNSIGVPHFTYNYQKEFKKHVINDFIDCYKNCRTPNPCIECNKYLKFGFMWDKAKELGCNYIATGHYAKTKYSEKYKRWILKKSNAGKKDQSYVLWNMPKDLVEHVIFPLANFENKDEIRKIATDRNLKVATKPDSEDICFVPDGNYKKFLEENSDIKPIEGNIVNSKEEVLGKHKGLYYYTIGQRKGLGISNSVPLFVIGFNKQKNEVIVGEEKELYKKEFFVNEVNLLLVDEITDGMEAKVKTRYSAKEYEAKLYNSENGNIKVVFNEPQKAITPGQSAVFYIDDIVLRWRKNNMINNIPEFLEKILLEEYGKELLSKIIEGISQNRPTTFRVNTLKSNVNEIKESLNLLNIKYTEVPWNNTSFILEDNYKIQDLDIYKEGKIYLQSLSSMIPAIIVNPKEKENILDMCAAPGGKTTQMAALSQNKAMITACEKNKIRGERLKFNLEKQGATRISVMFKDARNLDNFFSFDKILLDAPCSGSGTLNLNDKNIDKIFTQELVNRSVKTQIELLKKAKKILKKGGELIYSTCSILKEENEQVLEKVLQYGELEIVPIEKTKFLSLPLLPSTIDGTICIMPTKIYEGFFVAKLRKR